jgi:hypothetical protein
LLDSVVVSPVRRLERIVIAFGSSSLDTLGSGPFTSLFVDPDVCGLLRVGETVQIKLRDVVLKLGRHAPSFRMDFSTTILPVTDFGG